MSQATTKAMMKEILAHTPLTSKEANAFVEALVAAVGLVQAAHITNALTNATTNLSNTADGTTIATAVNLAGTNLNSVATKLNSVIAALQNAGILSAT